MRFLLAMSGALCVLSLLVAPVRAYPGDPPTAPRALIIGDSNIYGHLGKSLQSSLRALGFQVHREGRPTSGLARPDFYDWMGRADTLIKEHQPHVVLMMFGGNDGQRLEPTEKADDRIHWKEEAGWREAYAERVYVMAPRPGRIHKEYQLPFALMGLEGDLREIKNDKEFVTKREEILSMIWDMEEEIMGKEL